MTAYMPKVGTLGLDMMYRTCTVQTNLDFSSEADMVKKLRVSLALQPIATALFANSPFTEGKPNGFLSFRSEIWRDTDNDRTGMLPWAFEPGMGFERYVDYALDVPMYFVKRGDDYIDVAGPVVPRSAGRQAAGLPGERATISDWANHLSTIFPEVRLKRYLEMRGADGGPWRRLPALPAFWVGILYDDDVARRRLGSGQGLDRRRAPEAARRRAEARLCRDDRAGAPCSNLPRDDARARRGGPGTAPPARRERPGRDPLSASARRNSSRAASRRRRSCWKNSTGRGAARSSRSSASTRTRIADSVDGEGTPATVALTKAGVAFTLHEYDYDPNASASACRPRGARRSIRRGCSRP